MQHPDETECCPNHGDQQIPLIYTTKFDNYEYWCCKCGYKCDLFGNTGANIEEPSTELLKLRGQLEDDVSHYLEGKVPTWVYENGETENN